MVSEDKVKVNITIKDKEYKTTFPEFLKEELENSPLYNSLYRVGISFPGGNEEGLFYTQTIYKRLPPFYKNKLLKKLLSRVVVEGRIWTDEDSHCLLISKEALFSIKIVVEKWLELIESNPNIEDRKNIEIEVGDKKDLPFFTGRVFKMLHNI